MKRGLGAIALPLLLAACGAASLPPAQPSAASAAPAVTPMPAGSYASRAFQPPVSFTVPDGWVITGDSAGAFQLTPAGSQVDGIYLFRDVAAASQDPACPDQEQPGVGRTSTELVAWIRGLPGLTVSNPALATVGGLPATSIDLGIREGWTTSCSFASGSPTVPLFFGGTRGYRWIVYGAERMRLYLADLPGGGTLAISVDTVDGPYIDQLIALALPIVRSMTFATGDGASPVPSAAASATP